MYGQKFGGVFIDSQCMFVVEGRFIAGLVAAGGDVEVDTLKSDVDFLSVAPYYLAVNLTAMTVSLPSMFMLFAACVICRNRSK